ncbi:histidine phosphatase family protein [Cellulomonas soli]|uniref:Putative phosphoglycerate mutase GpmB n=1 Tax=Cellulomonas soli TaxID=931535 RepID=A0A512PC73_9CELL|nr:histidine phosphatase family protein [Cellulomonas soli]NYI58383.1 putative phosphoglycerate mutase [Cellulomonas soli]GEP68804.1 putative phosphoglycerate mutase GpmB [Cellulomonas soli]
MTLTLTLVRHGQTYLNARRLLQGWSDSPLTRTGRAGVRTTAAHLADQTFTGAYCSPSGRAVATATEIVRHHDDLRLRTDKDLRELHFGAYERRPEHELDALAPWHELVPSMLDGTHPGLPGGESGHDYMTRLQAAFDRIVEAHPTGHVLVVGHGLTLGAWLATVDPALGLVALPNASVSTVRVDDDGGRQVLTAGTDVAAQGFGSARSVPTPARTAVPVPAA